MKWYEWYMEVLRKFAVFKGRASRKEYWMFFLINFLISLVLLVIAEFVDVFDKVSYAYNISVLVPSLAVGVRRLHDIGKSGKWILAILIPLLGTVFLVYLFAQAGNVGENEYGADPKINDASNTTVV